MHALKPSIPSSSADFDIADNHIAGNNNDNDVETISAAMDAVEKNQSFKNECNGDASVKTTAENRAQSSLNDIDDDYDNNCNELKEDLSQEEEERESMRNATNKVNSDANTTTKAASSSLRMPLVSGHRLALLPDYRSKTLWLASLVDESSVLTIVNQELQFRLYECLRKFWEYYDSVCNEFGDNRCSPGMHIEAVANAQAKKFCRDVTLGISAVLDELKDHKR